MKWSDICQTLGCPEDTNVAYPDIPRSQCITCRELEIRMKNKKSPDDVPRCGLDDKDWFVYWINCVYDYD